jgi:hypothetical protein
MGLGKFIGVLCCALFMPSFIFELLRSSWRYALSKSHYGTPFVGRNGDLMKWNRLYGSPLEL